MHHVIKIYCIAVASYAKKTVIYEKFMDWIEMLDATFSTHSLHLYMCLWALFCITVIMVRIIKSWSLCNIFGTKVCLSSFTLIKKKQRNTSSIKDVINYYYNDKTGFMFQIDERDWYWWRGNWNWWSHSISKHVEARYGIQKPCILPMQCFCLTS